MGSGSDLGHVRGEGLDMLLHASLRSRAPGDGTFAPRRFLTQQFSAAPGL